MGRDQELGWMTRLDVINGERILSLLRVASFMLFIAVTVVAGAAGALDWAQVGVTCGLLLLSLVPTGLSWMHARAQRLVPLWWYVGHTVDVLTISGVTMSLSVHQSPRLAVLSAVPMAYFLVIAGSALRLHVGSTVYATALCLLAQGVLGGWAAIPSWLGVEASDLLLQPAALAMRTAIMLVTGGIAVMLIRRMSGMNEVLQEVDRKQARVLQQMRNGVLVCDGDRRVREANPAACEILGLGRPNMVGLRMSASMPAPIAAVLGTRWQELVEGAVMGPIKFTRLDGDRWVEITAFHVQTPRHEVTYLMLNDVTAQAKLDQQSEQFERLQAIRALTTGVAHEFNNIFAIMEASSFILSEATSKQSPQYTEVAAIRAAAVRAARFTRDLLDLAEMRPVSASPLDAGALLRRALEAHQAPAKVEVRWNLAKDLWAVQGDEGQIERALGAVIAHAYGSMLDGGTLTIEASNHALSEHDGTLAAGDYVCIRITDTGIGMPPDAMARAFEPMPDADARGGVVGLANVQATAARHKGSVKLQSVVGQGSTITLTLPASSEVGETTIRRAEARAEASARRLLVVDDEAANRTSLARLLSLRGYEVLLADGGVSALRIVDEQRARIDLVLLDLLMPEMNGKDVLQAMRARHPGVKILLVTGVAEQLLVQEAMELGAAGVAYKPFDVPALLDQVQSLCAGELN